MKNLSILVNSLSVGLILLSCNGGNMDVNNLNTNQLNNVIKLGVGPRSTTDKAMIAKYNEILPKSKLINDKILELSKSYLKGLDVTPLINELKLQRSDLVKPINDLKLSLDLLKLSEYKLPTLSDYVKLCFSKLNKSKQ